VTEPPNLKRLRGYFTSRVRRFVHFAEAFGKFYFKDALIHPGRHGPSASPCEKNFLVIAPKDFSPPFRNFLSHYFI
jgi:hypothetical protein